MYRKLALLILISFSLTRADYHYASHTGTSEYPYSSWETAADSIQKAINSASPHDTVYVGSGEYHERVVLNRDSLSLIGMGWDSTLVWWDHSYEVTIDITPNMWFSEYIEGLYLQQREHFACFGNGARWYIHFNSCRFSHSSYGIGGAATPMTIENCIFDSLGSTGVEQIYAAGSNIIRNCLFWSVYEPIAINGGPAQKVEIANNIFYQTLRNYSIRSFNDSDFVYNNLFYYKTEGIDIGLRSESYPMVMNNTMDDTADWAGYGFNIAGSYPVVSNNSISNNEFGVLLIEPNYFSKVTYNALWNCILFPQTPGGIIDSTGNIYSFPMFINPDSGDYHLQAYSPLIDAGDPDILDYDGTRSDIGFYGGPRGTFYEYHDLPPHPPDSLSAQISGDTIFIRWNMNEEADFNRYIVNRDTFPGFEPWAGNIVAEPETSLSIDLNWDRSHDYYYKIAAYDNQWNLSRYSQELAVLIVGIRDTPGAGIPFFTAIEGNYPNPFNSRTTIIFSVANLGPIPAKIELDVFDILGRKVKSLINERKAVGQYQIVWDGRDDNGNDLTSGIYFAKLNQWGISFGTLKLSLVK